MGVTVFLGIFVAILFFVALRRPMCSNISEPTSRAAQWRSRAERAHPILFAAFGLQLMGLLTGLAAPAIPWLYNSYYIVSEFTLTVGSENRYVQYPNVYMIGGGVTTYFGLVFFIFPSTIMLIGATARVRSVAADGRMPPVACCVPSLPAVQALSWIGSFLVLGGALSAYTFCTIFAAALASLDATGAVTGLGSGGALLAFSLFCLFISSILASVAGCCTLGNLPGVGVRRGCCCCVESDAQIFESPAAEAEAKAADAAKAAELGGAPSGTSTLVVRALTTTKY